MPFISNGVDYKVIDDSEFESNKNYKHHGYVIVRRLFVAELPSKEKRKYLFKRFSKYGVIESIELLKRKNEGYVTFTTDHDAGFAFMTEKDCSETQTQIAYMWHQPEPQVWGQSSFELNQNKYWSYIAARRLFVTGLTQEQKNDKYLRDRFNKYGEIKSIQMYGNYGGFVTFVSDKAADMAFQAEKDSLNILVDVVYTWHQSGPIVEEAGVEPNPKRVMLDESNETSILKLPDDCLFMIFDLCDNATLVNLSETCVRFANLLTGRQYRFPNINKTLIFGVNDNMMTLAEVHKVAHLMGCHFEKLILGDFELKRFCKGKLLCRYLQEIAKYCTNIQHMEFIIGKLRTEHILTMQSILNNLKTFKIYTEESDIDPEIDLTELLPNLKEFKVNNDQVLKNCLKKLWPSLHALSTNFSFFKHENVFFTLNPQIRRLKLEGNGISNLKAAADHLPNIEQLKMFHYDSNLEGQPNIENSSLLLIQRFTNLIELELDVITIENLNKLLGYLKDLNKLKILRVKRENDDNRYRAQGFQDHYETSLTNKNKCAIVDFVKANRNIEILDLHGFELDDSIVIDIVRFSPSLKSLHLHECNIDATAELVTKLVEVRKCILENPNKLELLCCS